MYPYEILLFDLDGTLSDSAIGITTSFSHAMQHYGVELPPSSLRHLIGPPLLESFTEYLGKYVEGGEQHLLEAIGIYRERYDTKGKFENVLYDGIVGALAHLKQQGFRLGLATSKAKVFAVDILKHFSIAEYFDVIEGASLDGSKHRKSDVIEVALAEFGVKDRSRVVLIGDTHYDMEGAKIAGIDAIAVLWGYGDEAVLKEYHPVYMANTPEKLVEFLSQ